MSLNVVVVVLVSASVLSAAAGGDTRHRGAPAGAGELDATGGERSRANQRSRRINQHDAASDALPGAAGHRQGTCRRRL